jgi:glycosyltransferase involved in cell wall biosynthesis
MNPFFSIIIPTYNRAHLIGNTIQSVLSQSYPHFEIIVVDDGSTDNTEDVIASFDSPKIRYIKIKNSERGYARNYGAKQAKGEWLYFLDSDDKLYPNHLEVCQ